MISSRISQGNNSTFASVTYVFNSGHLNNLGNNSSGSILLFNLEPRMLVMNCFLEVLVPAANVTTLTCAIGRVSPNYDDYILSSDLKTKTLYGITSNTRGVNLGMYDVASITDFTPILMKFDCSDNLSIVTNLEFKVSLRLDRL
jgi:hypothetical protein